MTNGKCLILVQDPKKIKNAVDVVVMVPNTMKKIMAMDYEDGVVDDKEVSKEHDEMND